MTYRQEIASYSVDEGNHNKAKDSSPPSKPVRCANFGQLIPDAILTPPHSGSLGSVCFDFLNNPLRADNSAILAL